MTWSQAKISISWFCKRLQNLMSGENEHKIKSQNFTVASESHLQVQYLVWFHEVLNPDYKFTAVLCQPHKEPQGEKYSRWLSQASSCKCDFRPALHSLLYSHISVRLRPPKHSLWLSDPMNIRWEFHQLRQCASEVKCDSRICMVICS